MISSQSDANGYITPNVVSSNPMYPRWMYHPTNPAQVVFDQNSQQALVASDSQWSTIDPNQTT